MEKKQLYLGKEPLCFEKEYRERTERYLKRLADQLGL